MLLALTGCTNDTFTRIGFPDPVTEQGKITLSLWQGSWIAGMLVGLVVWGMILWAVVFHRKRGDKLPAQVRYNMPIEILYTIVPFVLIAVLFYYTAKDENAIDNLSANPAVTVNVLGFQWSWEFNYPQAGVTTDGYMWGTGPLPVLEIPVGETVQFNLTSTDVVHAFWVPEFLFKRDVIPGHPNHFQIKRFHADRGPSRGNCSELCGVNHSKMLFAAEDRDATAASAVPPPLREGDPSKNSFRRAPSDHRRQAGRGRSPTVARGTRRTERSGHLLTRGLILHGPQASSGSGGLVTSFVFFLFAGLMARCMIRGPAPRPWRCKPGHRLLDPAVAVELFPPQRHDHAGCCSRSPMFVGFANELRAAADYRATDVAFPRLNLVS